MSDRPTHDRCPAGIDSSLLVHAWDRMTTVQLSLIEGLGAVVGELERVRQDNARTRWLMVVVLGLVSASMVGQAWLWSSSIERMVARIEATR